MEKKNIDTILHLMDIYSEEHHHRDNLFWKQTFYYFYANLLIIFLPYISSFIGINLPEINPKIFPAIGIVMSLLFWYVLIGYSKRLEAIDLTYIKLMSFLDENLQRIRIDDPQIKLGKFFTPRMAPLLVSVMYLSLIILSALFLFDYIV